MLNQKSFEIHDLDTIREIQQQILNSIKDDFGRYKDENGNDKINDVLKLRVQGIVAA